MKYPKEKLYINIIIIKIILLKKSYKFKNPKIQNFQNKIIL